jgi:hypothetical protein
VKVTSISCKHKASHHAQPQQLVPHHDHLGLISTFRDCSSRGDREVSDVVEVGDRGRYPSHPVRWTNHLARVEDVVGDDPCERKYTEMIPLDKKHQLAVITYPQGQG